jgi:hypothetical protein
VKIQEMDIKSVSKTTLNHVLENELDAFD